jgi:hypothetical protein
MPRQLPADLLQQVQTALLSRPEGLSIAELETQLQRVASRRTLQRRLERWVRELSVRADGQGRARRYFRAEPSKARTERDSSIQPKVESGSNAVSLSSAGEIVRNAVRRPLADRPPIGYQREFLERYLPNETPYLSATLQSHLRSLGHTPDDRRPAGTYARDILGRLLIDLSWSSSRLEGNTYSLLDTRDLIERGVAAPGKNAKETQMILNHKAAIELLVESAQDVAVNRYTLTNLHALLADNLLDDPRQTGRLRATPVAIEASAYIPTAIPQIIEEEFETLLQKGAAISNPFEQSFFLMVHLPYLQPFIDVNKRTSRLAANISLIKHNLVPLSFIDVPEEIYLDGLIAIYELNRVELLRDVYIWAYERSARRYKTIRDSLPEPDAFRLRHRLALTEVIGNLVRENTVPTERSIAKIARPLVPREDLAKFTHMAFEELSDLHEGNIARFRIRPSEFRKWSEKERLRAPIASPSRSRRAPGRGPR